MMLSESPAKLAGSHESTIGIGNCMGILMSNYISKRYRLGSWDFFTNPKSLGDEVKCRSRLRFEFQKVELTRRLGDLGGECGICVIHGGHTLSELVHRCTSWSGGRLRYLATRGEHGTNFYFALPFQRQTRLLRYSPTFHNPLRNSNSCHGQRTDHRRWQPQRPHETVRALPSYVLSPSRQVHPLTHRNFACLSSPSPCPYTTNRPLGLSSRPAYQRLEHCLRDLSP